MNEIMTFSNSEFGEIRTVTIDGEPWFVGKDVCKALGYSDVKSGTRKNVDEDDKRVCPVGTPSGTQQTMVINESGLYSIIFGSKLESAKRFKKWVTSEVLPSIRKTGQYGQPQLPQTTMELLELHYKALKEVGGKVEKVSADLNEVKDDYGQQRVLEDTVNKTVIDALGGKGSYAYEEIGKKVFAECNRDLKHYFNVNARANVPKKRFEEAVEYAKNWKPCTNTIIRIQNYNAQQSLEV